MRALALLAITGPLMFGCAADAQSSDDGDVMEAGEGGKSDVCEVDDTEAAACVALTDLAIHDASRAVLRLKINGGWCTGWLVGAEGHVLTNHHCVRLPDTAKHVTFEAMAEGASCAEDCSGEGACPGTIIATESTLLKTSIPYDYTLLQLPAPAPAELGYLQIRREGATVGERIYVPQHPMGGGKRISVMAGDEFTTILGLTDGTEPTPCLGGGTNVRYRADTQPGSSGSPVIAYSDQAVVALHHCNGCANGTGNRGVPIENIVADLGDLLPPSAFSTGKQ